MKLKYLLIPSHLIIASAYSISLPAAQNYNIQAYQVWNTINDNPRDIRKLKKLFDAIAKDPDKLKELATFEKPASNFLTKLATLKLSNETADIFEKYLSAIKKDSQANLQNQLKNAITELDPMCNLDRPREEKLALWQRTIIALIRQAKEFDICEWSEKSFIDAALRYGNAADLQKVLKNIASDWYTGEMLSRLQENMKRSIMDDKTGTRRKFVDIVLDFEPIRLKNASETERTLRDEIKNRIKNPLDDDDPKILKEILKIMDERNKP